MKGLLILTFIALLYISSCYSKDLTVGSIYNTRLLWQTKAEYMAIPFKKRVKDVFYADPNQQIFKGIIARDIDHTEAIATITAGGVGFSYANIQLKSARGSSLNYHIEFYA